MPLALVTTVRNERRLLRDNLRYHHWLGVDRSFVFLDRSTDGTGESVRDLAGVTLSETCGADAIPARHRDNPVVLAFLDKLDTHQTARQMLNTLVATEWALAAGCDWIVSLDPDELLCPSWTGLAAGDLGRQLGAVGRDVQVVQFMPLEVLPSRAAAGATPFQGATRFKNRFALEGDRFRHAHRFPKRMHDPVQDQHWLSTDYLGHVAGKAAARTGLDLLPGTVHTFLASDGSRPPRQRAGWLLHYCNVDFESFLTRFRHRRGMPAHWTGGVAVDAAERLWQAMVNDGAFTERELEEHFWREIVPTEDDVATWRRAAPASVVDVPAVANAFAAIG